MSDTSYVPENGETVDDVNDFTGQNFASRDDFMASVSDLGTQSGMGKNALPRLAFAVAEAIEQKAIVAVPEKGKPSDIEAVWDAYVASETTLSTNDRSEGAMKVARSKLQQVANAATNVQRDVPGQYFSNDVLIRVKEARDVAYAAAGASAGGTFKPLFDCIIDAARLQLKNSKVILTDDQIAGLLKKPAPKAKTLRKHIEQMRNAAFKLVDPEGKSALKVEGDDFDTVTEIVKLFDGILSADDAAEQAELKRKAAAFDAWQASVKAAEDAAKEAAEKARLSENAAADAEHATAQ